LTSISEVKLSGQSFTSRVTWDMAGSANIRWSNDGSVTGGHRNLIGEYACVLLEL